MCRIKHLAIRNCLSFHCFWLHYDTVFIYIVFSSSSFSSHIRLLNSCTMLTNQLNRVFHRLPVEHVLDDRHTTLFEDMSKHMKCLMPSSVKKSCHNSQQFKKFSLGFLLIAKLAARVWRVIDLHHILNGDHIQSFKSVSPLC